MKTKEEIEALKEEYKTVCKKFKELSEDELRVIADIHCIYCGYYKPSEWM